MPSVRMQLILPGAARQHILVAAASWILQAKAVESHGSGDADPVGLSKAAPGVPPERKAESSAQRSGRQPNDPCRCSTTGEPPLTAVLSQVLDRQSWLLRHFKKLSLILRARRLSQLG